MAEEGTLDLDSMPETFLVWLVGDDPERPRWHPAIKFAHSLEPKIKRQQRDQGQEGFPPSPGRGSAPWRRCCDNRGRDMTEKKTNGTTEPGFHSLYDAENDRDLARRHPAVEFERRRRPNAGRPERDLCRPGT